MTFFEINMLLTRRDIVSLTLFFSALKIISQLMGNFKMFSLKL